MSWTIWILWFLLSCALNFFCLNHQIKWLRYLGIFAALNSIVLGFCFPIHWVGMILGLIEILSFVSGLAYGIQLKKRIKQTRSGDFCKEMD